MPTIEISTETFALLAAEAERVSARLAAAGEAPILVSRDELAEAILFSALGFPILPDRRDASGFAPP